MALISRTAYFFRSAWDGIRHAPFVHLVAVLTIAIALFTVGLARGATVAVESLIGSLGGEVELTVYVQDGVADDGLSSLEEAVRSRSGGEVRRVLPAQALAQLAERLGDLGAALRGLPDNPLPLSFEVRVPESQRTPGALASLSAQLRALPGVTGVDYGEAAVARLSAIAAALRFGGLLAFAVLVVATVIIVSATLQLAIYARREEIEIQKLVGATDRFVKTPFLLEGLVQGVLGAAVASVGLVCFMHFAVPTLNALFGFLLGPAASVPVQGAATLLELFAMGSGLGLLGSFLAVGRFLRV